MQTKKDYFKVIQITDTHLFKNNASKIFGLSSNNNFEFIVNEIKNSELHDTDVIFLTGDLSQDETIESYTYMLDNIRDFKKPTYWIPGNHDAPKMMSNIFKSSEFFIPEARLSTHFWDFIFVDSKIDGRESGYISTSELKRLSSELAKTKNKNKNIAIVMHHHPASVNTPLVDDYILENRDEFWDVLKDFSVNLIICGHVHNDYTFRFNDVTIETAPATCLQWKKGTTDFVFESKAGFKVYYFWDNSYEAKAKVFDIQEDI